MVRILEITFVLMLIVAFVGLAAIISASLFIGGGYLLTIVFPLTLFQSSVIFLGVVFFIMFLLCFNTIYDKLVILENYFFAKTAYEDEDDDEYEDDDVVDQKFDYIRTEADIVPIRGIAPKIGRNQACTCGSGKKYKYCCGR